MVSHHSPDFPLIVPVTLPGLYPILALITLGCHPLVMGLFPPALDQELPESLWSFGVSIVLSRTGTPKGDAQW